jgi:5-aminopentanamidase
VRVSATGSPIGKIGPVTITADCRLDSALDKTTGPRNGVHADRRPGLYRRVSEERS